MRSSFICKDFPFDTQDLKIHIASATYMATEVELVPTKNSSLWGANSWVQSWALLNYSQQTVLDKEGLLDKSRGVMSLVVKRPSGQYLSTVFLPSSMLLAMTWTSLWLPLAPVFTMPRVALNAIYPLPAS